MAELSKLDFIANQFPDWAKITDQLIRAELIKNKVGITDALINSLKYRIIKASSGDDGKYLLSFLQYGRFRDMGVGRGVKIESIKGNAGILKAGKKRKKVRFYSKVVYKRVYGALIGRLVAGYREQIIKDAKGNLKAKRK